MKKVEKIFYWELSGKLDKMCKQNIKWEEVYNNIYNMKNKALRFFGDNLGVVIE